MVSSKAPKGTVRMPSSLRSSRINSIACRKFSRHSSRDSPWPLAPGTSGQYPTNQPPSRSMMAVNSCFIRRLYGIPPPLSRLEVDRLVLHRAEGIHQPLVERRLPRLGMLPGTLRRHNHALHCAYVRELRHAGHNVTDRVDAWLGGLHVFIGVDESAIGFDVGALQPDIIRAR